MNFLYPYTISWFNNILEFLIAKLGKHNPLSQVTIVLILYYLFRKNLKKYDSAQFNL